jgi:hypothetical protein
MLPLVVTNAIFFEIVTFPVILTFQLELGESTTTVHSNAQHYLERKYVHDNMYICIVRINYVVYSVKYVLLVVE